MRPKRRRWRFSPGRVRAPSCWGSAAVAACQTTAARRISPRSRTGCTDRGNRLGRAAEAGASPQARSGIRFFCGRNVTVEFFLSLVSMAGPKNNLVFGVPSAARHFLSIGGIVWHECTNQESFLQGINQQDIRGSRTSRRDQSLRSLYPCTERHPLKSSSLTTTAKHSEFRNGAQVNSPT